MNEARKLSKLVALQDITERQRQAEVGSAVANVADRRGEADHLVLQVGASEAGMKNIFASGTFCPDRMLLAAGRLTLAEDALTRSKVALSIARKNENGCARCMAAGTLPKRLAFGAPSRAAPH